MKLVSEPPVTVTMKAGSRDSPAPPTDAHYLVISCCISFNWLAALLFRSLAQQLRASLCICFVTGNTPPIGKCSCHN